MQQKNQHGIDRQIRIKSRVAYAMVLVLALVVAVMLASGCAFWAWLYSKCFVDRIQSP